MKNDYNFIEGRCNNIILSCLFILININQNHALYLMSVKHYP